jgi:hypothetical protein
MVIAEPDIKNGNGIEEKPDVKEQLKVTKELENLVLYVRKLW